MALEMQETLYLCREGNKVIRTAVGTAIGFLIGLTYGLWQYATPDGKVVKFLSYIKGFLEVLG
jgi:hypothetical protein